MRLERGPIGIVPAMTLHWDFDQAKGWMLDPKSGIAAPLTMGVRDVTPASREVVATELGLLLDKRGGFEPTPDSPLPPPLAGGHCRSSALPSSCIEAWDGLETLFSENCDGGTFDFSAPCKREGLRGVCENLERTVLRYDYVDDTGRKGGVSPAPACHGRWHAARGR